MIRQVAAEDLRWSPPDEWLPADSTAQIEPSSGIIGQDRAVHALEFGLAVESLGFNVFVTGLTGTGKMTAIELHLRPLAAAGAPPEDLVYVYNFTRPEQPRLLQLRAGRGVILRDRLDAFIRELRSSLPQLLEGEDFQRRVELAIEDLQAKQQELLHSFEKRVKAAGFTMVQVQVGSINRPEILPLVDDRPVALEKLQSLAADGSFDAARLAGLEEAHNELTEELAHVFHEVMALREEILSRVAKLRRSVLQPLVARSMKEIARAVGDPRVEAFLGEAARDLLENIETMAEHAGSEDGDGLLRYRVNPIVDNAGGAGRPIVIETEPTYVNLFGTIEGRFGDVHGVSDHTRIRAGSLLRANGGFLVLNAFDVLSEPAVWPALKRALRFRRVIVRPPERLFALTGQALSPQPVDLDVKVVMVGDRALFEMLLAADEEFGKIFKVLADFDDEMECGAAEVADFMALMSKIIRDENLAHLDRSGMAALLEESVRMAGSRRRLSARFSDVADLLREAAFLARSAASPEVTGEHVRAAVRERRARHSLPEEKLVSLMMDRVLRIESAGRAVGQVNGLAVYDLGYHSFGMPGRVTARVGVGRGGVINIEREARLSGRTHDKGVLIIAGWLNGTFGARLPLAMSASIAFEQSYSGIDGDSASSTEIYALLSALAAVPIRQDVAVTGSVDQHGAVQAIGGVNEKVEGFFELCRARGLTGTQGVLIPAANVADLQLDHEVVEAVRAGQFSVWAVERVEDGIELLTGVPAGELSADGAYPARSVFGRCAARFAEMADAVRALAPTPALS